jgi:hypothetical protein
MHLADPLNLEENLRVVGHFENQCTLTDSLMKKSEKLSLLPPALVRARLMVVFKNDIQAFA